MKEYVLHHTSKDLLPIIKNLYVNKLMSDQQIQEVLKNQYLISVSRQAVSNLIKKYIGRRKRQQSNKVRAITGRMDYKKIRDKIDYQNRKIDYQDIGMKRSPGYYGPLKNPKTKQVSLPQPYVDRIREYAKNHGETISDTLRGIFFATGHPIDQYQKFILRPVEQSFKPYSYNFKVLTDLLDAYLKGDSK